MRHTKGVIVTNSDGFKGGFYTFRGIQNYQELQSFRLKFISGIVTWVLIYQNQEIMAVFCLQAPQMYLVVFTLRKQNIALG